MTGGFGFIEIPLKLSTHMAAEFRKPGGFTHFGTVTFRLDGDPEVLTVWFDQLDAHNDGTGA